MQRTKELVKLHTPWEGNPQNPYCGKLYKTNDQISSTYCKERDGGVTDRLEEM